MLIRSKPSLAVLSLATLVSLPTGAVSAQEASPPLRPSACVTEQEVQEFIRRVNVLRERGGICPNTRFATAPPLRTEPRLMQSSMLFAVELAENGKLDHFSIRSGRLRDRLRTVAYRFAYAAENLAAGQESIDELLEAWLPSIRHCQNLFNPRHRDVGLACAPSDGPYSRMWVMQVATDQVQNLEASQP